MKITIVDGKREYSTIDLDPAREYSVGRSSDCDVVLKTTLASRNHARLFFAEGTWRIADNKSTNGTFLNGRRITEAVISNYDVVRVGDNLVEFNEDELLNSIIVEADRSKAAEVPLPELVISSDFERRIEKCFGDFRSSAGGVAGSPEFEKMKGDLAGIITDFANKTIRMNQELKVLFELTKSISEILNLKQLMNIALDLAQNYRKFERGLILLFDAAQDRFIPYVTRKMGVSDLQIDENAVSGTILSEIRKTGQPVLIMNSLFDARFASAESVVALSGKSIMCIPLISKRGIQGAFYLEKSVENPFSEEDMEFLKNFAGAVSVAVENSKLIMAIRRERQIRNNMERYISPNLIEQLSQTSGDIKLDGEKRMITVLFADIKNFTKMSETLAVEDVFSMLNQMFSGIAQIVFRHDGTLDKFIGDCVMAFFGAPLAHDDDPVRAVRVAAEIVEFVEGVTAEFREKLGVDVGFSIGVNTGEAIVGNVGSLDRMEYTAIGDTVNLAARLQAHAGFNDIVINESVFERLGGIAACTPIEPFHVKGKENPVKAFRVDPKSVKKQEPAGNAE